MMGANWSRIAAASFVVFAGWADAGTPLVIPLTAEQAKLKSVTDLPVRLNQEGLAKLQSGAEVDLVLPNGSQHQYLYEHSISHGGGLTTFVARSPLTGDNERAIITYGPQGAWGSMRTPYGDYRIYPSGKGYDLVARTEARSFAPQFRGGDAIRMTEEDDPSVAPFKGIPTLVSPATAAKSIFSKVTPSPVAQADVMFLYTKDLATKLGVGLMPMLHNLIATINQAYADSEVAIVLRLVNATMIDYPNSNGSSATLSGMRNAAGNPHSAFFEPYTWGASSIRNTVGADFVALLRDGPTDTGGIAGLLSPGVFPNTSAYSVNNFCAGGCEGIVAHELGHNMGNHHDPATIAFDSGTGTVNETGVFAHSIGYYSCANGLNCNPYTTGAGACTSYARCSTTPSANDNDFGTIMSYFNPRVMKFSNPLLTNCVPSGGLVASPRACGGAVNPASTPATTSNNALSMNDSRTAISAYRTETIANLPGSLQFTNTGFSGAEGSNLNFTVSRMGGTSGTVTVNYAVTAGGSATAGTDFTLAAGTLQWAPGDGANKTITASLAPDALVEGVETISVTLSSPTGAPGVFLGYPTVATGFIVEPWPLGTLGQLPTDPVGWTNSSLPWSIVNDSAPAGDPDGRSFKSAPFEFYGPNATPRNCIDPQYTNIICPSSTEITRNFSAGTVAYAYRVSGFPNFGFLEFLVDGVVVHTATGNPANAAADTGWQTFSTTIAAGNHTLKWQYRSRFNFPCDLAGTPNHPNCLDRAWIDQLALPPNTAFADPPRLVNISTRGIVRTGDNVMIGGFIIGGSSPKTVVVRARGPSLAQAGVPGVLANPQLSLYSGQTLLASNDNWQQATNASAITASGQAPTDASESAILMQLNPGAYTAIVSGVSSTVGIAIIEVFEIDAITTPLINISTRGLVETGDNVMIGGFIVQGTGPQTVVVRARGPSLAQLGVPGVLANPQLSLFSGQTLVASNDNWQQATNAAAITASGQAPTNINESAILMTLNPGAYTAIVSGVGNGTGIAIVEVFTVP